MSQMTIEQAADSWIQYFRNEPDMEWAELDQLLYCLEQLNGRRPDLDIEYFKYIKRAISYTIGSGGPENSWHWHAHEIVKGKYPIEKLPEHVRALAQELYY